VCIFKVYYCRMNPPEFPPWKSLTPNSTYERLKIAIATVTLIGPLKFLTIWILIFIGWLMVLPIGPKTDTSTIGKVYRKVAFGLVRLGCRLILFTGGFYWVNVRGSPDDRAKILVSTHHSLWDSLWFIWSQGASQTAKADLFENPLVSGFLFVLNSVPVDRFSRKGRREAIHAIKERVKDTHGHPLLVFPTGICSNGRQLMEFKRGAFEPGVPIQPVGIAYPARHFDQTHSRWPLWDMYRSCCQIVNFLAITYLPARFPTPEEKCDTNSWAKSVREHMSLSLGMRKVNYAFETECVRLHCRSYGLIFNEEKCRITNLPLALSVVDAFSRLDCNRDGWIDEEDAAHAGQMFQRAFKVAFPQIKTPMAPYHAAEDSTTKMDSWMDVGMIGLITGGRKRLPPRPIDPHRDDALEVAEVIDFFNRCLVSKASVPDASLVISFNLSSFFVCQQTELI
jgi:1-acyl-sn-glycerol-3-phosphate acyltransferase